MATATATTPAEMEQLLLGALAHDTNTVRVAEAAIHKALRSKKSVRALTGVLRASSVDGARHLAAVLLYSRVATHWIHLSEEDRAQVKSDLLHASVGDANRLVRLNACYVVAVLARNVLAVGPRGWPELLQAVQVLTRDADAAKREVGFTLLYSMAETLGSSLKSEIAGLAALYTRTLRTETDAKVLTAALRAVAALIDFLSAEDDVSAFQSLVPDLIRAVAAPASSSPLPDEVITQVVENLSELADSPVPVLDPHASQLVETLCSIMLPSSGRSNAVRSAAVVCLVEVVCNKPRVVFKSAQTAHVVLDALAALAREAAVKYQAEALRADKNPNAAAAAVPAGQEGANDDDDDNDNDDDVNAGDGGWDEMRPGEMLELVGQAVSEFAPANRVAQPLLRMMGDMMQPTRAVTDRVAGTLVLTVCAEGLKEHLSGEGEAFPVFLDLLLRSLTSDDAGLRRSALVCLGQWAEQLGADITERHASVLPPAVQCLLHPSPRVRRAALYLVAQFCESMEPEELVGYADPLVGILASAVYGAADPHAAAEAVETLGNFAFAVDDKFGPYLRDSLGLGASLIGMREERLVPVRKAATHMLARLVVVAEHCHPDGTNPFANDVPEMLRRAFDIPTGANELSRDAQADLAEVAYVLCGHVAMAMRGPRLDALLPDMLRKVLEGCRVFDDDDVERVVVDRDADAAAAAAAAAAAVRASRAAQGDGGGGDDEDDDDDDDEADVQEYVPGRRTRVHVRPAAADLKCAALFALETMAECGSKSLSAPFFPDITTVVEKSARYPHATVRAQGLGALAAASLTLFDPAHDAAAAPPPTDAASSWQPPTPDVAWAVARATHTESDLELPWVPGRPAPFFRGAFGQALVDVVHPALMEAMMLDTSKEVAAAACDALAALLKAAGPHAVPAGSGAQFVNALEKLLSGQAACQNEQDVVDARGGGGGGAGGDDGDDNDDAEDDEERRHDEVLVDSVADALATLTKVLGAEFAPFADQVVSLLLRFSRASMPPRDRVTGVGCLCQLVQHLTFGGEAARVLGPYAAKMFKLALTAVTSAKDQPVRRNATFLVGVMAEAGLLTAAQCVDGLTGVRAAFDEAARDTSHTRWDTENRLAVMDNACGAVARLLGRLVQLNALSADKIEAVVGGLVAALPIREDHLEDWVCYDTLALVASAVSPPTRGLIRDVAARAVQDLESLGVGVDVVGRPTRDALASLVSLP